MTVTNNLSGSPSVSRSSSSGSNNDSLITRKGSGILLGKPSSAQPIRNIPNKIPPTTSWWGGFMMGLGALGAQTVLAVSSTKARDLNLIRSIVPDGEKIIQFIRDESPRLQRLLADQVPFIGEFIKEYGKTADKVTKELIFHVIGNLILESLPEDLIEDASNGIRLPDAYQLTPEALMEKCFLQVVGVVGPHLNKIHSRDVVSKEHFIPLVAAFLGLLFPPNDAFRIVGFDSLRDALAEKLHDVFGKKSESESEPISSELSYYVPMFVQKMTEYSINQDVAFFKNLTGQDDIAEIVEKLSGPLLDLFELPDLESYGLNSAHSKKAGKAAVFRLLSNACSDIFKGKIEKNRKVATDDLYRKIATYFSKKLRRAFKEADHHPNKLEQFYPNSAEIVKLFLPKWDWLNAIIQRCKEELKPIAEAHFALYNATVKDTTEDEYKARLRAVLWDYNTVFNSGVFGADRVPLNSPTKDQSIKAGLEPTVEKLYSLCGESLSFFRGKGADYLGNPAKALKLLDGLQKNNSPENQFSTAVLTRFASAMNKIFKGGEVEINKCGDKVQHILMSLIFKALVRWLEKVPGGLRSPPEELLFRAFEIPLSICVQGFTNLGDDILFNKPLIRQHVQYRFTSTDSSEYIADQVSRDAAIASAIEAEEAEMAASAVAPTVSKWIDIFFDSAVDLPIPGSMKKTANTTIHKKASSLVGKIYTTLTRWIVDRKNSEAALNDLFPSKNPLRMCRMIPHLAVEGISYGIRENEDAMMLSIESKLNPDDLLKGIISGFIHKLGDNNSNDFKKLLTFVGVFSETAAVRFLGQLFGRIHQMEEDRVSLTSVLEDLLKGNLQIVKEHLKGIQVAKENKLQSRKDLVQSFKDQGILHPALIDDDSRRAFFSQITEIIFKIFKIKESDFPVPNYAKKLVFDSLTQYMPGLLNGACDQMRDAATINGILVAALNQGTKDEDISILDRLFSEEHTDFKEHLKDLDSKFSDQFQKDLQEELGETVQALVGLQTDRIPKYLVRNEGLKNYAAEAIGQPLRAELHNKKTGVPISLLSILDGAFQSASDSLAPSFWKGDTLVYLETTFKGEIKIDDQTGKNIESDTPTLARFFPRTKKEKSLKAKYDAYHAKKMKKNVPRYLRKLISDQTSQIAIEAFILFWAHLEKEFSQWLEANIGAEYGEKIYNVLLPVTRWVIKYPLSVALIVFNYSIWLIASQLLKWELSKEAEEIIKDVNINIHDNAIYKALELVLARYAKELEAIKHDVVDDDSSSSSDSSIFDMSQVVLDTD